MTDFLFFLDNMLTVFYLPWFYLAMGAFKHSFFPFSPLGFFVLQNHLKPHRIC